MKNKILNLEKSLFKYKYMSDIKYLNKVIDDNYKELGKSGKMFFKEDVIKELSSLKNDRKIVIYNYNFNKLNKNIYLVSYITKNENDNIYRISIWKRKLFDIKIIYHQASIYKEKIELIKC